MRSAGTEIDEELIEYDCFVGCCAVYKDNKDLRLLASQCLDLVGDD